MRTHFLNTVIEEGKQPSIKVAPIVRPYPQSHLKLKELRAADPDRAAKLDKIKLMLAKSADNEYLRDIQILALLTTY
jgi:hypothetical protein